MAFTDDDLLLSPDKAAQLTKALATIGVADPLQYLCDEAAADVARLTTGYVISEESTRSFIRALALFRAYAKAGPVPADVKLDYDSAVAELMAIAKGERPNLERTPAAEGEEPATGNWGSITKIKGRTELT